MTPPSRTEAARGAAVVVVPDDTVAPFAVAVAEGHRIYENIRRALFSLLSPNLSKVIAMGLAMSFGLPRPFLPLQTLWIHPATDGRPGLSPAIEPADA